MTLPVIDVPVYEMKVPSTGEIIKVRPFTVKEEKLLLMAAESKKIEDVSSTVKQIVNNCIIEGKFDVETAPFYDIDYAFIYLRAKSIGEKMPVELVCVNKPDGANECGNVMKAMIDMNDTEVTTIEKDDKIEVGGGKGVKMKYPAYSVLKKIENEKLQIDKTIMMIIACMEYIYDDKGQIWKAEEHSIADLKAFIEGLTEGTFKKLEEWTKEFPSFIGRIKVKCSKCGYDHDVRYTDFADFFP